MVAFVREYVYPWIIDMIACLGILLFKNSNSTSPSPAPSAYQKLVPTDPIGFRDEWTPNSTSPSLETPPRLFPRQSNWDSVISQKMSSHWFQVSQLDFSKMDHRFGLTTLENPSCLVLCLVPEPCQVVLLCPLLQFHWLATRVRELSFPEKSSPRLSPG